MTRGGSQRGDRAPTPISVPPRVCKAVPSRDTGMCDGTQGRARGLNRALPMAGLGGAQRGPAQVRTEPCPSLPCPSPHLRLHPRDAQPRLCPAAGGMSTRALPGPGWGHRPGDVGCRPPSTPCSSPGCAGSHLLLHAHNALRLLLIPLQRWGRGDRGARGLLQGSDGLWGRGDLGVLCPPQLCNHSKV